MFVVCKVVASHITIGTHAEYVNLRHISTQVDPLYALDDILSRAHLEIPPWLVGIDRSNAAHLPSPAGALLSVEADVPKAGPKKRFRRWRLSDEVVRTLRGLSGPDLAAFSDLIDRLDADPFAHSSAVLVPGKVTLRRSVFGPYVLVFAFDPSLPPNGGFLVAACEPITRG